MSITWLLPLFVAVIFMGFMIYLGVRFLRVNRRIVHNLNAAEEFCRINKDQNAKARRILAEIRELRKAEYDKVMQANRMNTQAAQCFLESAGFFCQLINADPSLADSDVCQQFMRDLIRLLRSFDGKTSSEDCESLVVKLSRFIR